MKLYLYSHCPYCVRVQMGFHLKALPVEEIYLSYDDEETPGRLIGRKMLPILEDADGIMGESLDILQKIDGLSGHRSFDQTPREEITEWLARWKATIYGLVLPRVANPGLPEFRTARARAAFVEAKERAYGPFTRLLERSGKLMSDMERGLHELSTILPRTHQVGIDDILLFPMLRSINIVNAMPANRDVQDYYDRIASLTGFSLHDLGQREGAVRGNGLAAG
ncbi:glutaredoxin 2 [Tabrizicola sp.]|uniref:glutaredoxin 2 n=1 Tax=Tabrizicola sp. TaxID=2005166 RepID=UPI002FDD85E8